MSGWVASLSDQEISNWELCKKHRLFGSGAPRAAGVQVGDTIYFWWGKHGLFARARATSDVERVTGSNQYRIPWPSPDKYRYLIDIEILDDLAQPLSLRWKELDELAGLRRIPASQFPPVTRDRVARIDTLFKGESNVEYTPS